MFNADPNPIVENNEKEYTLPHQIFYSKSEQVYLKLIENIKAFIYANKIIPKENLMNYIYTTYYYFLQKNRKYDNPLKLKKEAIQYTDGLLKILLRDEYYIFETKNSFSISPSEYPESETLESDSLALWFMSFYSKSFKDCYVISDYENSPKYAYGQFVEKKKNYEDGNRFTVIGIPWSDSLSISQNEKAIETAKNILVDRYNTQNELARLITKPYLIEELDEKEFYTLQLNTYDLYVLPNEYALTSLMNEFKNEEWFQWKQSRFFAYPEYDDAFKNPYKIVPFKIKRKAGIK